VAERVADQRQKDKSLCNLLLFNRSQTAAGDNAINATPIRSREVRAVIFSSSLNPSLHQKNSIRIHDFG